MKIKITEPTRLHLEYLLGKDEKAWAQTIERVVAALSHNYWLRDYFSTYDINAHCKHEWIKRQEDGTYKCIDCDKAVEVEEQIPY